MDSAEAKKKIPQENKCISVSKEIKTPYRKVISGVERYMAVWYFLCNCFSNCKTLPCSDLFLNQNPHSLYKLSKTKTYCPFGAAK